MDDSLKFILIIQQNYSMTIDLHIHSTFSDGTNSPDELVALAVKGGLSTISLTDHDTMAGTGEIVEAGKRVGIEVIPGLELSVVHGGKPLHILGYWIDENDDHLQAGLVKIQQARKERNKKIIDKLMALGIRVTMDELEEFSGHGQAGRPHIGALLIQHGVVKNINQAFKHYLKKGRCAYVARDEFKAKTAIRLIKQAGGLAVLAHPVQFDASLTALPDLFEKLVEKGLDGVEVYYPTQSASYRKKLCRIAERYDLLYTGGSDYHGDIRPGTSLGIGLNEEIGESIIKRMKDSIKKS